MRRPDSAVRAEFAGPTIRTGFSDRLFGPGAAQHQVKIVCLPSPVLVQCLAKALGQRIEFGVWAA
ncbi:MAG: WhiB family transcriptional regulator [Pseudonocardiaceae bacterium]